jgi:hypothetical protein
MRFKQILLAAFVGVTAAYAQDNMEYIAPHKVDKVAYKAEICKGGALKITLDKNTYIVNTMFSLMPGWAKFTDSKADGFTSAEGSANTFKAATESFQITRKIIRHSECIEVADTIKNKSSVNLPLLYRNQMDLGRAKEYYICGYRTYGRRGKGNCKINSTVICMPKNGGSIGLLALDDIFRTHFQAYSAKGIYGIADDNLVLAPGKEVTLRWAAFPAVQAEYFGQINAMRRFLGVNYKLDGSFTFLSPYPKGIKCFNKNYDRLGLWSSIDELRNFIVNKGAKFVSSGHAKYYGEQMHGSAWLKHYNLKVQSEFFKKLREAVPDVITLHYFHCFIDVLPYMDKSGKYDADKTLTPSGKQADYRNPNLPLFQPTLTNEWGKMQQKRLEILIDKYKVDGIYWDEFADSAANYHYGEPWDGVSGDIDPRTHKLIRTKTSISLLSMPWRVKMVDMITSKGKRLIVNGGGAKSETMMKLFNKNRVMGFVETGSITSLIRSQLSTPIGLGDHLTERNETDCYRNMVEFLKYGALYYWYYVGIRPITHKTLTSYMFPITPVEIGNGYVIGKERIIAAKSGWYSFGAKEKAEAHFFDQNGVEVKREFGTVEKDGKVYYKIVLGKYESCALVRK